MEAKKTGRKRRPKAGTVTIRVVGTTKERLKLEMSIERKKGEPEVVPLQVTGLAALRAFTALSDPSIMDPEWRPKLLTDPKRPPKVGEVIYVRTSISIDHGQDDVMGGLARVVKVEPGISAGKSVPFVTTQEQPGNSYNWEFLAREQEKLSEQFGTNWAYPDPER